MKWFLYAFGIIWITCGSCMILYTAATRETFKGMLAMLNIKVAAVIALILGVLFFAAASTSHYPWIIRIIGIIAILKGAFFFANPGNAYAKVKDLFLETLSDQTYRFTGIVIIIFGTAILSWIV